MTNKELAATIRKELKAEFNKLYDFRVRILDSCFISISINKGIRNFADIAPKGYANINQRNLKENYENHVELFKKILAIARSKGQLYYNNFYIILTIGSYNKPYQQIMGGNDVRKTRSSYKWTRLRQRVS